MTARTPAATERTPKGATRIFTGTITDIEPIMGDSSLITFLAPDTVVAMAHPGNFVDVLCRGEGSFDPLLRRPLSVYRADLKTSQMTVLVRPYGRGSSWLCAQPIGTRLGIMGPLGNKFDIGPKSRNLLMVAGGVGAAPLLMLAEQAVARGLSVTYLMGAVTESALLPASAFRGEIEYVVATDDGSQGSQGFVTALVPEYLQWADQIFSCGPTPMFHSLRDVVRAHRVGSSPSVQVSMEQTMACALGACLGCVVQTKSGMKTSCVEGPVFDMEQVVWS